MEKFHEKLKVLRKKLGLTQKEIADIVQVNRVTYTNWEKGNREPSYEDLCVLAFIFDVSIDFLLSDYLEISKESYLKFKKEKEEEKKNLFSVRLKELRKEKGYTQEQMANILEIGQSAYAKWENGKCKPNYEKLEKIADFFGVSLDWLFGRK